MNEALQKTIELFLIILLGYFLQKKLPNKQSLKGIKVLILSVALPATIFIALLKIQLQQSLLFLPLLALSFNLIMFGACLYLLPKFLSQQSSRSHRTYSLLLPSLAPGLSCFPFIVTYLGDDQLAVAALADVGNKFFGLILLFVVAMYWYRRRSQEVKQESQWSKLKNLFVSLGSEPINLVILLAILLLCGGFQLADLPVIGQNIISKLSTLMIPMILLFIGLSVRIGASELFKMIRLLSWRAGMAFILSGLTLFIFPSISLPMALLILVFPQSSCSFWPFAHICTVSHLEEKEGQNNTTFDQGMAINLLACSLPFSTCIIISIFNLGSAIVQPLFPLLIGISLILISLLPRLINGLLPSASWKRMQPIGIKPDELAGLKIEKKH